jgi:CubicO group peptidase (beta-lactamase class C family)
VTAEWGGVGGSTSSEIAGYSAILPQRVKLTDRTWFDLASLTKPLVTTTLTLLAFRSNTLAPATRVGEVIREVRGSGIGELEVEALLTHVSGLPAWLPLYCLADGRPGMLAARLADMKLEYRTGERVVYSCLGFVVLGMMLERVAGVCLDTLFRREVALPLGLGSELGFKPDPETQPLAAGAKKPRVERRLTRELGFDPTRVPATGSGLPDDGNARFLGGVAGNAGLFGTSRGVMTLASEYLGGSGKLLTEEEATAATGLRTSRDGLERGWGWQIASSTGCSAGHGLSSTAFGHTGFTGVSVWGDPATASIYILLANRNHPGQRENDLDPLRRSFHLLAAGGRSGGS